ncbi:MAG: glycosyltransferase family 39 protein, partial [Bacteroidetes bacterium]|nr:glycosyltransferase family 39 protein [Bacteroidota bacterium]
MTKKRVHLGSKIIFRSLVIIFFFIISILINKFLKFKLAFISQNGFYILVIVGVLALISFYDFRHSHTKKPLNSVILIEKILLTSLLLLLIAIPVSESIVINKDAMLIDDNLNLVGKIIPFNTSIIEQINSITETNLKIIILWFFLIWIFLYFDSIKLRNKTKYLKNKVKHFSSHNKVITKKEIYILVCLSILFLLILYPRIGIELHNDEPYIFQSAAGLINTGKYVEWDFSHNTVLKDYNNNIYTYKSHYIGIWMVSGFFQLFGIDEIIARAPFIIMGILLLLFSYIFSRHLLKSRIVAWAIVIFIITNPFFIYQTTNIRTYVPLMLFSLLFLWFTYKSYNFATDKFNKKMILMMVIIFILGFLSRPTMLIFLPAIAIFYLFILTKYIYKNKTNALKVIITIITIILLFLWQYKKIDYLVNTDFHISTRASTLSFFNYSFILGAVLISLLAITLIIEFKNHYKTKKALFLLITSWAVIHAAHIFFITDNNSLIIPRYMSHVILINFVLLFYSLERILHFYNLNPKKILIILIIIILFMNSIFFNSVYLEGGWNNKQKQLQPWSSNYNFFDMYTKNVSTSKGRIEANSKIGFSKIIALVNENHDMMTNNNTIILLSPFMSNYYLRELSNTRNSFYFLGIQSYTNNQIPEFKDKFDYGIVMWWTRKGYEQVFYELASMNMTKISGLNI